MPHPTTDPLSESPTFERGRALSTEASRRAECRSLVHYVREYARENPGAAALWCFGIGFVVGWKLKPW